MLLKSEWLLQGIAALWCQQQTEVKGKRGSRGDGEQGAQPVMPTAHLECISFLCLPVL